jgi:hypothetical protein
MTPVIEYSLTEILQYFDHAFFNLYLGTVSNINQYSDKFHLSNLQ